MYTAILLRGRRLHGLSGNSGYFNEIPFVLSNEPMMK